MIPSFKITITILLGMVFISHIPSTAQTVSLTEKKKALVQRILEEKRHLPADTSSTIKGAKTTASDDRITATGPGVEEAEISIIYDPVDPNKLILSFMHITGSAFTCEFPIYYSSDAGATWTQSSFSASAIRNSDFPSTGSNSAGDPTFAWDKTGRVYFAWIYLSDTVGFSYFTLNWAYSDDNGHTWSVAPKHFIGQGKLSSLTSLPLPYKDGITDREWLAVDNSTGPNQGNVYCSFLNVPSDTTLPPCEAIKVLKPAIDTFGPIVNAYTGFIQFGNVEVSNTGVLHVSFADVDSMQVKHTSSSDGGVSYTPSELISPAINLFPSHGGPFVVHNRENSAVNLSSDGPDGTGNNVHVVWSDFPGGTVTSYYSNSIDGGLTWSAPLDLNGLFGGQITFMPTVAADGNKVTISFTGIDGTGESNYYQFTSIDNGVTFSSPLLLSSASTYYASFPGASSAGGVFFGDYNRSVRTTCTAYATWEDGRDYTDPKVFFARTNYCTLGIKEITSVTSDVQLISVFPNPATDHITLRINSSKTQPETLVLSDLNGKQVINQQNNLKNGSQDILFPLHGLAAGTYMLSLTDADGIEATRGITVK